jgi:hypothetical protein
MLVIKYYSVVKTKENEMDGACGSQRQESCM